MQSPAHQEALPELPSDQTNQGNPSSPGSPVTTETTALSRQWETEGDGGREGVTTSENILSSSN